MELNDDKLNEGCGLANGNAEEPEKEPVTATDECVDTQGAEEDEKTLTETVVKAAEECADADVEPAEPAVPDSALGRFWEGVKSCALKVWKFVCKILKMRWGRLIAIALLVLLVVIGLRIYNNITEKKSYYESLSQTITEMKQISEFCTAQYLGEVMFKDEEKVGLKNKVLVLIMKGTVRAGFDLTNMQTELVGDTTLNVTLPPAKVLDIITNPDDTKTFVERGNWKHERVTADKNAARAKLLELVLEDNLLATAEENGIRQLTSIFMAFGFKHVNIKIADSAGPEDFDTVVGDSVSDNITTLYAK